jgi:hypothetical protein
MLRFSYGAGLAGMIMILLAAGSASADLEFRQKAASFLDDFVTLSNQRNLEGLLGMYAADPVMIKKGEEIGTDIRILLAEQFKAWDRRDVEFAIKELQNVSHEGEEAVLDFIITGKGRVFLFLMSRDFQKKLTLRQMAGNWIIVKDETF